MTIIAPVQNGWGDSVSAVVHWLASKPNHTFWYGQLIVEFILAVAVTGSATAPAWMAIYILFDLATSVPLVITELIEPHSYMAFWIPKQYVMLVLMALAVAECVERLKRRSAVVGDLRAFGIVALASSVILYVVCGPSLSTFLNVTYAIEGTAELTGGFLLVCLLVRCEGGDFPERWHAIILAVFLVLCGAQFLVANQYVDTIGRGLMLGNSICYAAWAVLFKWERWF